MRSTTGAGALQGTRCPDTQRHADMTSTDITNTDMTSTTTTTTTEMNR